MNVQKFFEEFRYIANAPIGVGKLREMILTLAMQGRLVKQSSVDVPASVLLKKIEAEKRRLVQKRQIKIPKKLIEIKDEEKRYILPAGWEWVRFGNIAQHNSGKTLDKRRNTGHPRDYITTSNLYWGNFKLGKLRQMLIQDEELERCTARKGDLLICEGGEAGRAAVWPYDKEISFQNHIHRCRFYCDIDPYFAYRFFEKLNATGEINQYRKGVGISNMSGRALASIVFPLPPLKEQIRILVKVDELMALCDKLEAKQQKREALFKLTRDGVLNTLTSAQIPDEMRQAWLRFKANLGLLIDGGEEMLPYRQTICDLAIKGNLSTLSKGDTSVSETLMKIEKTRMGLIAKKVIKRVKSVSSPRTNEIPFPLPKHWNWVKLDQLSKLIEYGTSKKAHEEAHGVPILRMGNIQDGRLIYSNLKYIDQNIGDLPKLYLKKHDLIFNRTNSFELVGKLGIFEGEDDTFTLASYLIRVSLFNEFVNPYYINLYFQSSLCRKFQIEPKITAQTNQANFSGTKLRNILIPLPPIEEQERLVSSTNRLMKLCDQLEQQKNQSKKMAISLAASTIATLTGTQSMEQEKMKAPKTELVTKLQMEKKPSPSDNSPLANIIAKHKGELSAKALWQQSGLKIDVFYQQLKSEMANGWIIEPEKGVMKEVEAN